MIITPLYVANYLRGKMKSTKFNMIAEPNGVINITNEDSVISIQPDGTISISTYAPLQLTGASLAKLDCSQTRSVAVQHVVESLFKRLPNKKL